MSFPLFLIQGKQVTVEINGKKSLDIAVPAMPTQNGFIAIGTDKFGTAYYDNFKVISANINHRPQHVSREFYWKEKKRKYTRAWSYSDRSQSPDQVIKFQNRRYQKLVTELTACRLRLRKRRRDIIKKMLQREYTLA